MERDNPDDRTDDDVADYRDRARSMLQQIATEARQALTEQAIDVPVFVLVPSDGPIITFGTLADPDQELWGRVADIVSKIVQETVGLKWVWHGERACAATDAVAYHPKHSEISPTAVVGKAAVPIPTPAPLPTFVGVDQP